MDGHLLDTDKIPTVIPREIELLAADWDGFVGIGKEKSDSSDKQLMGAVDEFYLFPCVLDVAHIKRLKDFCDRHGKLWFCKLLFFTCIIIPGLLTYLLFILLFALQIYVC